MRRTDVLILIFKSQKRLDWVESQAREREVKTAGQAKSI